MMNCLKSITALVFAFSLQSAWAQVPHVFSNGQTADANEINENFSFLSEKNSNSSKEVTELKERLGISSDVVVYQNSPDSLTLGSQIPFSLDGESRNYTVIKAPVGRTPNGTYNIIYPAFFDNFVGEFYECLNGCFSTNLGTPGIVEFGDPTKGKAIEINGYKGAASIYAPKNYIIQEGVLRTGPHRTVLSVNIVIENIHVTLSYTIDGDYQNLSNEDSNSDFDFTENADFDSNPYPTLADFQDILGSIAIERIP